MLSLAIHNPPRRTRKAKARRKARRVRRSAPTAKQRANWARFARMAKAKARSRGKAATSKRRRRRVVAVSTRRATTVPKSRRKSRRRSTRRGRRGGGSVARRGFVSADLPVMAAGATAGFIIANKLPDLLPEGDLKTKLASNDWYGIGASAGVGAALYFGLKMLGRRVPVLRKLSTAVAIGSAVNVGYRAAKKLAPKIGTTMLGMETDGLGEMFDPAQLNGSMGEMFDPSQAALRAA